MIGLDALISFMKHPAVRELPFYTETPLDDEGHKAEIRMIKEKIGEPPRGIGGFPDFSYQKDKYDIFHSRGANRRRMHWKQRTNTERFWQ